MDNCRFKQVVVIGYGIVAGDVLKIVHRFAPKYKYTVEYIEHEVHPFNTAKMYAETEDICHTVIEGRDELTAYFEKLLIKETLIISASNNYIFPKSIVLNRNAKIINFHNALLPEFPGRNAASWAIYEGRKYTGITWHYVIDDIDAGDIVIQKRCNIADDIKAYELAAIQMQMAAKAFDECYEAVLNGTVKTSSQHVKTDRKIYKSYEVPGNGYFDLNDSPYDIYKLLRSIDYGKNNIFPLAKSVKDENVIRILRYKKILKVDMEEKADKIYLSMNEDFSLMLRYEIVTNSI